MGPEVTISGPRIEPDWMRLRRGKDEVGIRTHVARSYDSLGDEEVNRAGASALMMGVHIPKTWDQEFAFPIYPGG